MFGAFQELLHFLRGVTWKSFGILVALIIVATIGFLIFERYTSSFEFSRIQRATELLGQLEAFDKEGISESSKLGPAYNKLVDQFEKDLDEKPLSISLEGYFPQSSFFAFLRKNFWKFFAGGLPWIILWLSNFSNPQKSPPKISGLLGFLLFALAFGFVGMFLPSNPWINYFVYPVGGVFGFFILILLCFTIAALITRAIKPASKGDPATSQTKPR